MKLCAMKGLKKEVKESNLFVKDTLFQIRFTLGTVTVKSGPFRVVSSFSQLPEEEKLKRNLTARI